VDRRAIAIFLGDQAGVISRGQVLEAGGAEHDVARLLRRREWARVYPGVYVEHTGPLTSEQREWAAILYYAPAALGGETALQKYGVRVGTRATSTADSAIWLAVDRSRRLQERPGVKLQRVTDLERRTMTNLSPPRIRLEHAVLDIAAAADDQATAVAVLADACRSRRTTAPRLLDALEKRPRLRHRRLLRRILCDVAQGVHSVLEHMYLTRVERPHALPTARRQRQVRVGRTKAYRDVEYVGLGTIVELDGRLGHEEALDKWHDLERDIDAAVAGSLTLRVSWGQALQECRVAAAIARVLFARGWTGHPRSCSPVCPVAQINGAQISGAQISGVHRSPSA